jgi:two-component system OmpR family response regulator
MAKILLVEDDPNIAAAVQDSLEHTKHRVEAVVDGEEALVCLEVSEYDLIVLDMGLPKMSGAEVCSAFRARGGTTPVLMLTANDTLRGKEAGFTAGVDDYLTKPFHPAELLMRVKALLRRSPNLQNDVLTCGGLELDLGTTQVRHKGQLIRLSPIELALLEFLMRHKGRVFSQDELLVKVWPSDSERTPDSIRTCIRKLRAKIDEPGAESIIENLHGLGYRLRS